MGDRGKRVATPQDNLTYRIIGCAMAVHRNLGPGLRENIYQRALENSLAEAGLSIEPQRRYEVFDDPEQQRLVGYYVPDIVVEDTVIVEIKALRGLDNSHLAQVIGYLTVSKLPIGLLINFGEHSLRPRRVFPSKEAVYGVVNRRWLYTPDDVHG